MQSTPIRLSDASQERVICFLERSYRWEGLVWVALFANAALGGDHDPVTHPGDFLERPAEYLLDQSVAVHV